MCDITDFTYAGYKLLLNRLKDGGYDSFSYSGWEGRKKCAILRHDVDYSLAKAERIAEIEHDLGVKSTYYILLTSDLYNVYSKNNAKTIDHLLSLGHDIGLHFDEARYPDAYGNAERITELILKEAQIGKQINTVSMHRPSRQILDADLEIPGMINSYGKTFFEEFKYISDSRRRWREPVDEIIKSGKYERLHILTHPFWYNDGKSDIHDCVAGFVNIANTERYDAMSANITDISQIMGKEEIIQ